MREIKFRAWSAKHQTMGTLAIEQSFSSHLMPWGEDFQLMQYTGLKDEDGLEVFEGDIIEVSPEEYRLGRSAEPIGDEETENNLHRFIVEWSDKNAAFLLYDVNDRALYGDLMNGVYMWLKVGRDYNSGKVIGNIYENPELLPGENNVLAHL